MKSFALLLVLSTLTLTGPTFGQSAIDDQIQTLQRQLPGRLESKDYDGAVEIGEKIAALEKSKGPAAKLAYVAALRNVATWQRLALKNLRAAPKDAVKMMRDFDKRHATTTKLMRDIVDLLVPMDEPSMLASARFDLGVMLVGQALTPDRCSEAEPLFKFAIEHERKLKQDHSPTLLAGLPYLIDCSLESGDFEGALTSLEELVRIAESTWQPNDKRFLPIYANYASLLMMIGSLEHADRLTSRIRSLSNDESYMADYPRLLYKRAIGKFDTTVGTPPQVFPGNSTTTGSPQNALTNPRLSQEALGAPAYTDSKMISPQRNFLVARRSEDGRIQSVLVQVVVNEEGKVIESIARHPQPAVQEDISKLARKWRFRPLFSNGIPQKMTGVVRVLYFKSIEERTPEDSN